MTFLTFDPKVQSYQPADKLFVPTIVKQAEALSASRRVVDGNEHMRDPHARKIQQNLENIYSNGGVNELVPAIVAEQIMTSPVVSLRDTQTIGDARLLFRERGFRHVPVMTQQGVLAGIISDRDLLRHHSDSPNAQLASFVTQQVLVASLDTEIREIARVLFEQRIGGMPIVSSGQLLAGIVTRSDILRVLVNRAPLALWA